MLVALLIATSPLAAQSAPKPICHDTQARNIAGHDRPSVHPLGSEPPAKQIKAVVRTVDGCNKPLVVNAKVGAPKR